MAEMDSKWHEETKWDMYAEVAEAMADEHSCEELLLSCSDVILEATQYYIRKASATGGTLYKHGDMLDLAKYYYKSVVYMMALSEAMKKYKPVMQMIEKSELECFYDEYVKEEKR